MKRKIGWILSVIAIMDTINRLPEEFRSNMRHCVFYGKQALTYPQERFWRDYEICKAEYEGKVVRPSQIKIEEL